MDEEVEVFLAHYGVRGMKWGQRRARRQEAKADKKYLKSVQKSGLKIYNQAAGAMNNGVQDRINNKPAYRGKDLNKNTKLRDQYYKETAQAFAGEMNKALSSTVGSKSSTGNYKAEFLIQSGTNQPYLRVVDTRVVKHEDGVVRYNVETNALGHIIKYSNPTEDSLSQSALVDDFLSHYGVKGMKWGQRRARRLMSGSIKNTNKKYDKLSGRQKATAALVAGGAAFVVSSFGGRSGVKPIIAIAGGTGAGVAGYKYAVNKMSDKNVANKKVSEL